MDYLRYYVVSLMLLAGIAGFALGGYWLWAGLGIYVVLFVLALLSGPDNQATHHSPFITRAWRIFRCICICRSLSRSMPRLPGAWAQGWVWLRAG